MAGVNLLCSRFSSAGRENQANAALHSRRFFERFVWNTDGVRKNTHFKNTDHFTFGYNTELSVIGTDQLPTIAITKQGRR